MDMNVCESMWFFGRDTFNALPLHVIIYHNFNNLLIHNLIITGQQLHKPENSHFKEV